jgi:hypothetical protein
VSFALVVPADDSQPIALRELSETSDIHEQARELLGGLAEVVRARGLHELAPELWPVLLVDDNGHNKGLPPNRRAGELYGSDAIAGEALVGQERRSALSVGDLSGFTEAEAEQLRALLFRRVGRGRG